MAKDLNMCQFIGRLGREPEIRYLPNGDAVANFSIACSDSYKKDGQTVDKTEWVNVVAFRKLAEIIGEYLKKGSQVYIQGKFTTRKWDKDGVTRYATEVIADQMQMLGSKNDSTDEDRPERNQENPTYGQDGSASRQDMQSNDQNKNFDNFDDDIPF